MIFAPSHFEWGKEQVLAALAAPFSSIHSLKYNQLPQPMCTHICTLCVAVYDGWFLGCLEFSGIQVKAVQ